MRNEPTPPISDLKFQISDLPCPHCGYDLRGTDSPRCPECGKPVNRQNPSPIPWSHRRAVGRVRAFARTAVMAAVHPRRLAAAVAGPVSLADALAFRRATAAVAAVALLVPLTVTAFLPDVGPLAGAVAHPLAWRAELLAVPVVWVGVWLAVHTSAGVCTYWFHPRSLPVEQQNRAVALAYYACGPLALLPVPIACGVLTAAAALYVDRYPAVKAAAGFFGLTTSVTAVAIFVAWARTTRFLLAQTTHCGRVRRASLSLGMPVAVVAITGTFAGGLPAVYLWLAFVLRTLA